MDISVILWFQEIRQALGPGFDLFASLLSDTLAYAVAVIPFICYWCGNKNAGRRMIFALAISMYLNQFLKVTFSIYRPWIRDARVEPSETAIASASGYSFPSAHTQVSATAYGSLAVLLKDKYRKTARLCVFLLFLTGLSRVFLGVHTPQDVAAGLTIAVISIQIGFILADESGSKNRAVHILTAAAVLTVSGIIYVIFKPYPMDYADGQLIVDPSGMIKDALLNIGVFAGSMLGCILEENTLRFSTEGTKKEKILRFLAGTPGIAFFALFNHILPVSALPYQLTSFLRGFLAAVYAVYVYPLLFTKYRSSKKTGKV